MEINQTVIEEDSVGFHLGFTARVMKNALSRNFAKGGYNITPEQWHVLMLLWMKDGRYQHEIVEHASREKTTVARLLTGLEARNLILRVTDKSNKRANLIYLTNEGKKLRAELMSIACETLETALRDFRDDEVDQLKSMLTRIRGNLKELNENNLNCI